MGGCVLSESTPRGCDALAVLVEGPRFQHGEAELAPLVPELARVGAREC